MDFQLFDDDEPFEDKIDETFDLSWNLSRPRAPGPAAGSCLDDWTIDDFMATIDEELREDEAAEQGTSLPEGEEMHAGSTSQASTSPDLDETGSPKRLSVSANDPEEGTSASRFNPNRAVRNSWNTETTITQKRFLAKLMRQGKEFLSRRRDKEDGQASADEAATGEARPQLGNSAIPCQ